MSRGTTGRPGDPIRRQYEAYPYPARDPADERLRLITGSPSHIDEVDHYVFGGRRDWAQPFRASSPAAAPATAPSCWRNSSPTGAHRRRWCTLT